MFGYCCGHATIVALRQPLSSLFEAATGPTPRLVTTRVVLLPGDAQPEDDHSDDCAAALRGSVIRRIQAAAESRAVSNAAIRGGKLFDHSAATTQTTAGYSV